MTGRFYLVELQDGVEKQRIPVALDVEGFEAKVRVPGGSIGVSPGTFQSLEVELISEDGVRLASWPVDVPVQEGDRIHLPAIASA